jgi:hypothetical protein
LRNERFVLQSNFVRHNTPHPRDLKAKAEKLFGKGGVPPATANSFAMQNNAVRPSLFH